MADILALAEAVAAENTNEDTRSPLEIQKANEPLYRTSIKCIGWSKIVTALIYIMLFSYSLQSSISTSGKAMVKLLQLCLLLAIVTTIAYGGLLLHGTYNEDVMSIHHSLQVCLGLAGLDFFIGFFGFFTYIGGLKYTSNFVLLLVYIFILLQIVWTLCFDFPQIMLYKQLLRMEPLNEDGKSPDTEKIRSPETAKPKVVIE